MAVHDFDQLVRAVKKGELAPVYYLHGAEARLTDEALRLITEAALDASLRDFNYDVRSAAGLDPEAVYALCNTLPMMAERRVVVLRDVDAWQKRSKGRAELLRYLERPAAETVLILVQGDADPDADLVARSWAVRLDPLPPDRALRWIAHRASQLGFAIPADAAEHLLACVGNDLGALDAELAKLAALPEGTAVTRDLVGDLVGVRHGQTPFDWRDALLDGDAGRAARLLEPLLAQSGVSGVKLLTLLGSSLVGVGIARAHLDRGVRGRALEDAVFRTLLRVRPFGVGEWKQEARRWSEWAARWPAPRLRAALRAALDADIRLKSTTISDERGVLLDLVMRCTVPWREAA
jgi:DNA polymerase-3 subunit delta